MFNLPQSTFGRRSFLRFSALSVAAGSFLMNPISKAVAQAVKEIEPFYWNACVINCGQRCALRVFSHNGQVIRIETDNTQPDSAALSAALSKAARLFALKPITLQVTRAIIVRFALACAAVH